MGKIIKVKKGSYNFDASLKTLKTHFEDQLMYLSRTGIHAEVRERFLSIDYGVLRKMAEKLSFVGTIINCRQQQVMPFLHRTREMEQPGFIVCKKGVVDKRLKKKDKRAEEIMAMVEQTGFVYDEAREDDFIDFGTMLVREVLVIDQVAIEVQRNRQGEVAAFWLIDGATVFRCTSKGYEEHKNLAYVQVLDNKVTAAYTRAELVFDCMFKRVTLYHRGYGYALLEQAVDLVTTLILGITFNRDQFVKDKIPKGFLALQGEADQEAIQAIERYWYAAMNGVGARFTIPIIPSGKEGVSMDFKTLSPSNRDMEYHKLMLFFLSLFASVFGIDLAELGIKTDMTQSVLGENLEGRIKYSRDRGLGSLLTFISSIMNKIVKKIDENYEFKFTGMDKEDQERKYKIIKAAIESNRTINEEREDDGLDPLEGDENNVSLNPQAVQERQQIAQQKQQEEAEEYEEGEEGEEEDFEEKEEKKEKFEKHVSALRKAGCEIEI